MKKILLAMLIALSVNFVYATKSSDHKATTKKTIKKHKKRSKSNKKMDYMNGIASYYGGGDGFDNRQMADGDVFHANDPNLSAHPTLPLGTKLRVTNLSNGRTIYVEVTDRMPKHGRVIDLSKGAARRLGMIRRGIARVHLQIISEEEYQEKYNTIEIEEGDTYVGN